MAGENKKALKSTLEKEKENISITSTKLYAHLLVIVSSGYVHSVVKIIKIVAKKNLNLSPVERCN